MYLALKGREMRVSLGVVQMLSNQRRLLRHSDCHIASAIAPQTMGTLHLQDTLRGRSSSGRENELREAVRGVFGGTSAPMRRMICFPSSLPGSKFLGPRTDPDFAWATMRLIAFIPRGKSRWNAAMKCSGVLPEMDGKDIMGTPMCMCFPGGISNPGAR